MIQLPRFIKVCGDSMSPTYKEGELLVSLPIRYKNIKKGDVLIYQVPYSNIKRIVIKRVKNILYNSKDIFFEGDNSTISYDSRHYGVVPFSCVLGKIVQQRQKEERR